MRSRAVVLHVAETCKGGVGSAIRAIVNDKKSGFEHFILRPAEHDIPGLTSGVGVFQFRRSGRGLASIFCMLRALMAACAECRPDIVHAHSSFAGAVVRVALAVSWLGKRVSIVYTAHGWAFDATRSLIVSKIYKLAELVFSIFCDRIICLSRHELNAARRVGIREGKLRLVYNAHPVVPDSDPSDPYDKLCSNYRVLFVGRFDYQKGFDVLLDAIACLPETLDIQFVAIGEAVLGNSPSNLDAERVRQLGWQSPEVVYQYMRHATVVVVPSRWEGFALVPLEAMSLGTAVLCSDASSLPEAVLDGTSGRLFTSGVPSELARILNETSVETWHDIGVKAKTYCLERFSPELMLNQTREVYEEAMEPSKRLRITSGGGGE